MNRKEKRIVRELAHPLYTVEYLEKWLKHSDNPLINDPSALQAMAAKGYYEAVKAQVDLKYRALSREEQAKRDLQLGDAVVERIENLRQSRNLSFYELRKRVDLARQTFSCIMDGTTQGPTIVTIGKIAQGFSMNVREFFDSDLFGPEEPEDEEYEGEKNDVSKNN